jgi:hypothetical protein
VLLSANGVHKRAIPYVGSYLSLTRASDTQTGPHGDHPRDDQTRHGRPETAGHITIKPRKALVLHVGTAADLISALVSSVPLRSSPPIERAQPHHSALVKKTSHDFQLSLAAFQNAQKLSAERQRTVVQVVKQTAGEHDGAATGGESSGPAGSSGSPGSPGLQQTQLQIKCVCVSA